MNSRGYIDVWLISVPLYEHDDFSHHCLGKQHAWPAYVRWTLRICATISYMYLDMAYVGKAIEYRSNLSIIEVTGAHHESRMYSMGQYTAAGGSLRRLI